MKTSGEHPQTDCLAVLCSLMLVRLLPGMFPRVSPELPSQGAWQKRDCGMTVSQGSGFSISAASQASSGPTGPAQQRED